MAEAQLPATDGELHEAMEAVPQGLLWLDDNEVIRRHNGALRRFLGLACERQFVGDSVAALLRFLHQRGDYTGPGEDERVLAARLRALRSDDSPYYERMRPDGTVLRVSAGRLPSGGYLYSVSDATGERRAREAMQRKARATMLAMANFAEHRDEDTGIHVLRVSRMARQLAMRLHRDGAFPGEVDATFVERIGIAAILHDVGKIATPDHVLRKAGELDAGERSVMQQHTVTGERLLRQAQLLMSDNPYLEMGAQIALTHHEWYDGRGYPHALAGTDIPLAGRICAVADVYDALTSRRPYKEPWPLAEAAALIGRLAGTQFDPRVVDAFHAVLREGESAQLVAWTEAMAIGHEHIDEQHKMLVDTINLLADADRQQDRTLVGMVIDELLAYAAFHFHFEEELFAAVEPGELARHRALHRQFVEWVEQVRAEFVADNRAELGERILHFLRDWLRRHILGEDRRLCRQAGRPLLSAVPARP